MDRLNLFLDNVQRVIINPFIALLFAAALVLFIWGVAQMVFNADSDTARDTGKKHILWGLIGMSIMFGVYGILNIALGTFGIPMPR
jgi:phosphotransferase system  glucose/maltose/N-acetylglucosamine-specific IIC component